MARKEFQSVGSAFVHPGIVFKPVLGGLKLGLAEPLFKQLDNARGGSQQPWRREALCQQGDPSNGAAFARHASSAT